MRKSVLSLLGLVASVLGSSLSLLAQSAPIALRPGDALRITVWETEKLSGEFEVAPDGTLRHPVYSRLPVAGVPIDSLKGRIVAFLTDFQREPLVDFVPLFRVTVSGEVRTPGVLLLPPESTPRDVVLKAGGITLQGKERQVLVRRAGASRMLQDGDPDRSAEYRTILSGDEIIVPRVRPPLSQLLSPVASILSIGVSIALISSRR